MGGGGEGVMEVGGEGDYYTYRYSVTTKMIPALSPFLIGRMLVREPSWKYSANLVGS